MTNTKLKAEAIFINQLISVQLVQQTELQLVWKTTNKRSCLVFVNFIYFHIFGNNCMANPPSQKKNNNPSPLQI